MLFFASTVAFTGCKKQLDVKNPNEPTPEASTNEQGILSVAQGGIYINGFKNLKYGDGVFETLAWRDRGLEFWPQHMARFWRTPGFRAARLSTA